MEEEKEIILTADEALKYIQNNVLIHDTLELSYNKIYAPGKVLDVGMEEEFGEEFLQLTLGLNGEMVTDTVRVNMHAIKDELLELRHTQGDITTVVVVED